MRLFPWSGILMVALAFGPAAHNLEQPGHQASDANQLTSTVRIRLVSGDGTELGGEAEVERFQDDACGPNLARRFKHDTAAAIPYGVYTLRVHAPAFWSAEREVRVFQPNVLTVVALEIGMGRNEGGLPTSSVAGKIKNLTSSPTTVRLRLSGIYSNTVMDSEVETDGSFKFSGVPHGIYVLVATHDGNLTSVHKPRILGSEEVKVPLTAPVIIELKGN
jgi:hypothetical protein